ncbi:MAG: GlsB/YeaQ/YmgE family stress response membrane protein [Verrucomicrobiota bacterium]
MEFFWFLLVGLVAGMVASKVMRGKRLGLLKSLVLGMIGAVLGGFLFRLLGLGPTNLIGELVAACAGAVLFLWLLRKF